MITNIVNSEELFAKDVWSVNFLLPQEEMKVADGYSLIPLSELVSERKEIITLTSEYGALHYVGLENIESKTGRLIDFSVRNSSEIKSSCKRFKKGDILYGRLRPNLNKVYLNNFMDSGECSTEIFVLIPNEEKIQPLYLAELLRSVPINKRIVNMVKGAALPRISMTDLKQLELPIPSLEEQIRVAGIIAQKRAELEEHIKMAQRIPVYLSELITTAYA